MRTKTFSEFKMVRIPTAGEARAIEAQHARLAARSRACLAVALWLGMLGACVGAAFVLIAFGSPA
jgi:hypothetical protein